MTGKRKRKRKQRRPAVTEDEELAILRAIVKLTPHRASRLVVRHRWHQVVDAVVVEIGSGVEVSHQLCQRRYEILLSQFLVQHGLHKDWPENLELRQLLGEAVEERKQREEWATGGDETTPRALSLDALRLARAKTSSTKEGRASLEPLEKLTLTKTDLKKEGIDVTLRLEDDHKRLAKVEPEFVQLPPQSLKTPEVMEDLLASTPASHIPSECRSFVESTLVAVLDRLEQMEDTWLENAREERALM